MQNKSSSKLIPKKKPAANILSKSLVIQQTETWIRNVVIGCNFCPFAAKAILKRSIRYSVLSSANAEKSLDELLMELKHLDRAEDIETTFIIFSNDYQNFDAFLKLVAKGEKLLARNNYGGIYQLASFHPQYCFADADMDDAANYTNRSVYPMLHILREDSITKALENFPDPQMIPERNIEFARQKGLKYMQVLRAACLGK